MRWAPFVVAAALLLPGYGALAQETMPDALDRPGMERETPGVEPDTDILPEADQERVEELRAELKALLEQSREGAEDVVRGIQSATGLTDSQVYGIAAGIVAGAVIADLLGGNGLATLALASAGGALGNWIMSD